ncbi:MAG: hypothetical protein SO454_05790 [Candidatus Choladocola sp.]|nr:hypothetical protein [Candidatus Choladocola sp.]
MKKIMKWMHRGGALLLIAAMLFTQSGIVSLAEETGSVITIASAEDLVLLADSGKTENFSTGKTFVMTEDIDLSEYENMFIPIMDGTFDGGGHTITGIRLQEEMSDYGFFRYVGPNGTVANLTVEATVTSGEDQENIGIIAGDNKGTIRGCTSRGTLNGQTNVGGIAGKNETTGTISRCGNEAEVDGKQATGGITGYNEGTVSDCTNSGKVNTNQKVVKSTTNGEGSINISIPNAVTGMTADDRANDTGGIAGYSEGSITYCKNEATIGHERLGSATGGVVGRQKGSLAYSDNSGVVYGHKDVGGIVGVFVPYETGSYDRDYEQELKDELDNLSSLMDQLSDVGDGMGNHLSDNVDVLREQLKSLKNSVRIYFDDYSDMASDGKDSIDKNVGEMKDSINRMTNRINIQQITDAMTKISEDLNKMQKIMDQLNPLLNEELGDLKGKLDSYQEQIEQLKSTLKDLKDWIDKLPEDGSGGSGGTGGGSDDADKIDTTGVSGTDIGSGNNTAGGNTGKNDASAGDNAAGGNTGKNDASAGDNVVGENGSTDRKDTNKSNDAESSDTTGGNNGDNSKNSSDDPSQASTGKMTAVSYTVVTSTTPAPGEGGSDDGNGGSTGDGNGGGAGSNLTPEEQEALQKALQRLAGLNADIQERMGVITNAMGQLSGAASDMKSTVNSLNKMTHDLGKIADDFEDEFDTMTNDLRQKSDRVYDTFKATGDQLDSDWDQMSDCLDRVKSQLDNIRGTISDAFDELKDRIEDGSVYVDISELADSMTGDGKVIGCDNSGEIYADSQGGGIIGSISMETVKNAGKKILDLGFGDNDDDDEDEDDDSNSITRHVMAAVFMSVNTGSVTVKGSYAGGVVGRAEYGLINSCENYGDILADGGNYAGGIAGRSDLLIKDCYILSGVSGDGYVGGVAGRAEDVTGCYVCSYLDLDSYVQSTGAVAGKAKGIISDNYFVDNGYGAVDGVTKEAEAVPMDYASLLDLKTMPENFQKFTIRFMDGDDVIWQNTYAYGDVLTEDEYPKLPDAGDGYVYWEKKDVSPIHRNITVHAVYRAYMPSLGSAGDGSDPVLFGGNFYPDTTLTVRDATDEEAKQVSRNFDTFNWMYHYYVKHIYRYELNQEEELDTQAMVRVVHNSTLADCIVSMDDSFQTLDKVQKAEKVGSYLSVDTTIAKSGYIVVLDRIDTWMSIVLGILGLILLGLLMFGMYKLRLRRLARAAKKAEQKSTEIEQVSDISEVAEVTEPEKTEHTHEE